MLILTVPLFSVLSLGDGSWIHIMDIPSDASAKLQIFQTS